MSLNLKKEIEVVILTVEKSGKEEDTEPRPVLIVIVVNPPPWNDCI